MSAPSLSELVSLACHDIRTPLATASGFAGTLVRLGGQTEQAERFLILIEGAAAEIDAILDDLSLVARIENGRYEPSLATIDSFELARAAAARAGANIAVSGRGAAVTVDPESTERSLASLALCALRHGAVERVELAVDGRALELAPLERGTPGVIIGEDLRDLGAAIARRTLEAGGASVRVDSTTLVVTLPS